MEKGYGRRTVIQGKVSHEKDFHYTIYPGSFLKRTDNC